MRWARYAARAEEISYVYKVLVLKPEGKKQFGRSRHRWENNIKLILNK
jgi:hypothetical protein